MGDFHFLRPEWLVAVPLSPLLAWWLWRRLTRMDPWLKTCDPALLGHLRDRPVTSLNRLPFGLFALLGVALTLTAAGPTWDATEAAVHRTMRARVVALDLSRSMAATDVAPSRMAVAREKAAEVFERTTDDQVGLVVFAGEGFFIAPLSSDPSSLIGILPAFSPAVISAQGSRPDLGLREAGWLVRRAGAAGGEIVLITDGATGTNAIGAARRLWGEGIRVSVLAVGTEVGSPIPLGSGANLRDLRGREVMATTGMEVLRHIAAAGGGRFAEVTTDSADIDYLLAASGPDDAAEGAIHDTGQSLQIWLDRGPWFAAALLPLGLFAFRRGWVFLLAGAVCLPMGLSGPARATSGDFDEGGAAASRAPVRDASEWRWQAVDLYRAGRYVEAAALFGEGRLGRDHYNRGNALARAGFYRAAIAAYQQAINQDADNADARFNRALVESLLDAQQRQARAAGQGGGQGAPTGDAETSGSGESSSPEGTGVDAPSTDSGQDSDAKDGPPRDRGGATGDEEQSSASVRESASAREQNERQRVVAQNPQPGQARLTGAEMERLERTVSDIAERRLGLWRRKIEQQWRNNPRRGLAQSDAW